MRQNHDIRYVCERCVNDPVLHDWIAAEGQEIACTFCDNAKGPSVSIEQLAERIDTTIRQFYRPGPMQPTLPRDRDDDHVHWEQDGESVPRVLEDICRVEYDVAESLAEALSSSESYDDGDRAMYGDETKLVHVEPDATSWLVMWEEFEQRIKHRQRFFDRRADEYLQRLIGDLAGFRDGAALLRIGPGTDYRSLYRARLAQSDDEARAFVKRPLMHLVPPPPAIVSPGRMNPTGIPAFYGAFSSDVCVAEVRPPVGGVVVVARFHIVRPLTLLDLSYFGRTFYTESTFSAEYSDIINRLQFLRELQERLTRPVTPRDEPLEYVPTQAVAEFVSRRMKLDGLVYNSAQLGATAHREPDEPDRPLFGILNKQPVDKCNVALFGRARRVGRLRSSATTLDNRQGKDIRHALECDSEDPEPRRVLRLQLWSKIDYALCPSRTTQTDDRELFER